LCLGVGPQRLKAAIDFVHLRRGEPRPFKHVKNTIRGISFSHLLPHEPERETGVVRNLTATAFGTSADDVPKDHDDQPDPIQDQRFKLPLNDGRPLVPSCLHRPDKHRSPGNKNLAKLG